MAYSSEYDFTEMCYRDRVAKGGGILITHHRITKL